MILSGHIFISSNELMSDDVRPEEYRELEILGTSDFTSKFSLIRLAALRRIFLEA